MRRVCLPLLAAYALLLSRMGGAGGATAPAITKFENGSTVFLWDDGRRLENAANGDQIFTNKDGTRVVTKAKSSPPVGGAAPRLGGKRPTMGVRGMTRQVTSLLQQADGVDAAGLLKKPVSYTHLTLPTILRV